MHQEQQHSTTGGKKRRGKSTVHEKRVESDFSSSSAEKRKKSWRGLFHSVHHQSLPVGPKASPLDAPLVRQQEEFANPLEIRSPSSTPPTNQPTMFLFSRRARAGHGCCFPSFIMKSFFLFIFLSSSSSSSSSGITRRERERLDWRADPKTSGNEDGSALRGFVRSAL